VGWYDDEITNWPNIPGTSTSERSYITIKRLPGTPPAAGSARYEHIFNFDNGSVLTTWTQLRYTAGYNLIELTAAQFALLSAYDYQPSYALLNVGATWVSPGGTFTATVYGRNLLDAETKSQINLNQNTFSVVPGEPIVFGVSVGAHF